MAAVKYEAKMSTTFVMDVKVGHVLIVVSPSPRLPSALLPATHSLPASDPVPCNQYELLSPHAILEIPGIADNFVGTFQSNHVETPCPSAAPADPQEYVSPLLAKATP